MRISDWSSDVCSSDRGVVAARAAKAEKAEVKPVAVAVNAPPLKPAILNGYVLKGISQAGSHVAAWIDTGKGLVRSEEHTSELQSLMRISYAVFCLKKKNTKIIRISNIHQ